MIACGVKPDNTVVAVVNRTGGNLTAYRRSAAGAWAAGVSTTTNDMTPTGVAVHYASDFNVLWTGTPTAGGSRLASRIFGDGFSQALDTWSVSRTIVESAPSSNVVYATPFLGQPDVYRLTCREQYTGTGAFDRITHSLSPATADFASNLWADLRPLNHTETFGLALSWNSTHLFLTNARKVYAHALAVTSQDVTADVVAAEVLDRPFSERLGWVELDNSDVAYTTLALLTEGAEVAVSPGYYDAAGVALQSDGPVYWVTDIEFDTTVQPPVCRLWLGSVWAWLGKASLGRSLQHAAAAKSLFGIIQDLLARVGPFEFSSTGSSAALGNLTPAALVAPGAALLPALKRLIERSDDTLYNRGQFVFANQAQAADAADETYRFPHTTTTHPVTSARLRSGRRRHNYVRVLGGATGDVVGEAIEYSEVLNYYAGPLLVADRELTTGVLAGDRASAIARRQDIESRRDLIVAPVHCGLEVNDVIDVLDTRAGGTARKVRVRSLELRYRRGRAPVYEHRLEVGEA